MSPIPWILGFAALIALLTAPAAAQAAGATPRAPIAAEQQAVQLLVVKRVLARPVYGSPTVVAIADQRPISLTRTTLPVLEETRDAEGRRWLKVRLPGRVFDRKKPPRSGWISDLDTRTVTIPWHLVVDVDARRVLAYRHGRLLRSFRAIVGKPRTPTPRGEFFVEETMRLSPRHPGAPYALATSARSPVYQEFMGGPGQVALHGMRNIGGKIGSAASHGCVRLSTGAISWLAQYVGAGVPLTIR